MTKADDRTPYSLDGEVLSERVVRRDDPSLDDPWRGLASRADALEALQGIFVLMNREYRADGDLREQAIEAMSYWRPELRPKTRSDAYLAGCLAGYHEDVERELRTRTDEAKRTRHLESLSSEELSALVRKDSHDELHHNQTAPDAEVSARELMVRRNRGLDEESRGVPRGRK
jgi:hypothetical protein